MHHTSHIIHGPPYTTYSALCNGHECMHGYSMKPPEVVPLTILMLRLLPRAEDAHDLIPQLVGLHLMLARCNV